MFLSHMQMKKNKNGRRGFTLIELAIVLGVTSLLAVGLWRMMATGNTQMRDQATADQHKLLIKAVRDYLKSSDGQVNLTNLASKFEIGLNPVDNCNGHPTFCDEFRPQNMDYNTINAYGQNYEIRVEKTPTGAGAQPTKYSFMIKTKTGGGFSEKIPDSSGSRIANFIGGEGGFVYSSDICGVPSNKTACGAFGGWNANVFTDFGFGGGGSDHSGLVASRTMVGGVAASNEPWLMRLEDTFSGLTFGTDDLNTMQHNMSLGGNTLFGGIPGASAGAIEDVNRVYLSGQTIEYPVGGLDPDDVPGTAGGPVTPLGTLADPPILEVRSNCTETNTSAYGPTERCEPAMSVTGDIEVAGQITVTNIFGAKYVYDTTSDRRLKKNLIPLDNALENLSKIKGYQFVRKDTGATQYGVIAQEVDKVYPQLVSEIDNGYRGVDYMGFVGPLIAAVGELKAQNEELRAELEALKKAISKSK